MANEIWHHFDSAQTIYARIHRMSDDEIYDAVAGSGTFEPWNALDVTDYTVAMTDHGGDYHSADFPIGIAQGTYHVGIFLDTAGGATVTDVSIAQGVVYWGVDEEIDTGVIVANQRNVSNTYEERASVISPNALGEIQAELRS